MRWVNETRSLASLSCLRRPSIDVTASVRNEVAVGIDRLSSMYFASMPAPPRSGRDSAPGAGAVAGSGGADAPPLATVGGAPTFALPPPGPAGGASSTCGTRPPGAGASDVGEVDPLGGGDAPGHGGALRVGGDRRRRDPG